MHSGPKDWTSCEQDQGASTSEERVPVQDDVAKARPVGSSDTFLKEGESNRERQIGTVYRQDSDKRNANKRSNQIVCRAVAPTERSNALAAKANDLVSTMNRKTRGIQ